MKNDVQAPAAAQLWEKFVGLSAGPKQILRLKALVFQPTTKTLFQECLIRSGLRMPNGKAWTNPTINQGLGELRRLELLNGDLACTPLLLHPVAVDALGSEQGGLMVATVRRAFSVPDRPSSYGYAPSFDHGLERLLRLAIYANDEAALRAQSALFDKLNAPDSVANFLPALFWDADRGIALGIFMIREGLA
ncbi:MAG: hypothetical protein PHU07_10745 [Acidocella sp.]|nr:hypothetical protein [Acidocella sp.]